MLTASTFDSMCALWRTLWYNVRKGQSQVAEYTDAELARADVYLDI